jgi:Gpi18-like mannosyltransferase
MWLVRRLLPFDLSPDLVFRPYMGVVPESNSWLEVWQRWDVLHYQAIAERGYSAFSTSLFTTPLFPLLMRWASALFSGNTLLGGLLVSNVACLLSFWVFYLLAQKELGDEPAARRALTYLAIFPTAFFLFASYTESLYFLGAVLCLYMLRHNKWLAAGLWGAFAAFSRLTGMLLVFPVLWAAWRAWRQEHRLFPFVAPGLTMLGGAFYPLYVWLWLGLSPLTPFTIQSVRFHGGITIPGWPVIKAAEQIWFGVYPIVNSLDLFFTVLFIFGTILVIKHLPTLYSVYCGSFMLLYITRIADVYPLLSNARYVLALFPVFMVLPLVDNKPLTKRMIIYPSIMGLLFLSAQFAIWGWVG